VLAALVLLAITGAVAWAATTPDLRVRQVTVEGTTDAALIAAVRALPLIGCLAPLCDTARAATRVESLPQVASARAWLQTPSTLVVRITPRAPVVVWRTGSSAVLVGADGVVIGPASSQDAARLPAVDDPGSAAVPGGKLSPGTKLPPRLVELAAKLRTSLPALLGRSVSLTYDTSLGLVANDGNGTRVVFGDPSRVPIGTIPDGTTQLAELRVILATLAQSGLRASAIDLRWGSHPAYTLG
jgi:cell division septal protein FtsQ